MIKLYMSTFIVYDVIHKIINKTYTMKAFKKKRVYNSWKQINNLIINEIQK